MRVEADAIAVSIWFAWVCALLFLLGYTKITPWWERRPGWVASMHGWAFLMLTTLFVVRYVFHVNTGRPWFAWYYVGTFLASGVVELVRLWLVWSLQPGRERRKGRGS